MTKEIEKEELNQIAGGEAVTNTNVAETEEGYLKLKRVPKNPNHGLPFAQAENAEVELQRKRKF